MTCCHNWAWPIVLAICLPLRLAADGPPKPRVQVLKTPGGVRFGLLGEKKAKPTPTLFLCATAVEDTLRSPDFSKVGTLLAKDGCLCVALDVPCHGEDTKKPDELGLDGWRKRLADGKDFVEVFAKQASAVLDHLLEQGYTDVKRVAACGTSRGGFIALHWAAAEPRVASVVAFAPVTDLLMLREFRGMEKHEGTKKLALVGHARKLAGRPVWVCIGNKDERVGTDHLIALTRKLVELSSKKPAPVELHVLPTAGHRIHETAHEEAAAWIGKQWRQP